MSTGRNIPEKASFVIATIVPQSTVRAIKRLFAEAKDVTISPVTQRTLATVSTLPQVLLFETRDTSDYIFRTGLGRIHKECPSLPIIVLTPSPEYSSAVSLMQEGVYDYFAFPLDTTKLYESVLKVQSSWVQQEHQKQFAAIQQNTYDFSQIVGNSPKLQETLKLMRKVISSEYLTTLILGETGTGKELLAKAIHYSSSNKEHPFVEIGCSAIPETLLESELFGYEKGAFTDAREKKPGLFELAGKGTLFLDEIGDISPVTQSKLLKVIEEKKMRRIGGFADIPVEARIVAATSRNLEELVRKGLFRQDLYYRLKILPLHLPPLREREDDILLLADHFLSHFNALYHKNVLGFTESARRILVRHRWEGNVRELRHSIERAVVLTDDNWITEKDFDLTFELYGNSYFADGAAHDSQSPDDGLLKLNFPPDQASIEEMEFQLAQKMLKHTGGNKSQTADLLGISRPRLDRILKKRGQ
ncbi:MAG: sigma-54 dependent transcriptional regulator [Ignavibacteriales bacterium]|nr:sigma-54 dependent transcriptional regulator [Ignavibacteriales bacterium]